MDCRVRKGTPVIRARGINSDITARARKPSGAMVAELRELGAIYSGPVTAAIAAVPVICSLPGSRLSRRPRHAYPPTLPVIVIAAA